MPYITTNTLFVRLQDSCLAADIRFQIVADQVRIPFDFALGFKIKPIDVFRNVRSNMVFNSVEETELLM